MANDKSMVFDYDEFSDRLMIASKKKDEIIVGSIRILNLVLDITQGNRIANIELIDASDYLNGMGIGSEILNKLDGAEFSFKSIRNGYLIVILLRTGKKIERVPYNVHLPRSSQISVNLS